MASSLYKKEENGSLKKVATLYSESDIEEIVNPLLGDYLPLTGGTLNGNLIVNGVSTFQNTDYTSGVENQVVKYRFKTASNQYGAIYFGKEGPNNGAMIRLDQVEGTARLYFRASSTAGAIVWSQPESGSQLFFDVNKVNFRTAGYLADATSFRPSSNGTKDLGASAYKFKNVYATAFYENGTALSSKYAAKSHSHAISNITSLQATLDSKVNKSDVIDEYQVGQGTSYEGKVSSVKGVVNYVADNVLSQKGKASGFASLGSDGKVPSSQLPSYVDDVLEFTNQAAFPQTGEDGKIYVAEDTNKTYRWSGSAYVEISASLALGETASTAYAGDKGKQNADDIAALQSNKAAKVHTHTTSQITDLYDKLNAKVDVNGRFLEFELDLNHSTTIKLKDGLDSETYCEIRGGLLGRTQLYSQTGETYSLVQLTPSGEFTIRKNSVTYDILDSSMALTEAELNEILV